MNPVFILQKIRPQAILASPIFFWVTIVVFGLSAAWVALASIYPMAFDEDFHMGLIKIYATSWLPYGIEHTREMATYGAATADPSYLSHYILSFPYRLLDAISIPTDVIVVVLRFINIAAFIAALVIFRRGLIEVGVSKPITNTSIALFTLVPIAPVLAGQVNYDNPLFVVIALSFLLTVRISKSLLSKGVLPVKTTWLFFIVALFGMPTKYAYLTILAGLVLWLMYCIVKARRTVSLKQQWQRFISGSRALKPRTKMLLAASLIVGAFFSAHYVTNFVQYRSFIPTCDTVFDENACMQYGPWARNFILKANKPADFQPLSFVGYVARYWVPDMGQRLTFAVAGPTNGYQTKKPLPTMYTLFMVVGLIGVLVLLIGAWFLRSSTIVWITLVVIVCYFIPLAVRLYGSYVTTAQPVAINGRYLLPILPLLAASIMVISQRLLRRYDKKKAGTALAASLLIVVVLFGGGVGTYIVQAESHWFFSGWGQESHQFLKTIFDAFIIRGN